MTERARKRNFSDRYTETHRLKSFRQSLIMCTLAQSFSSWFFVDKFIEFYRQEVGSICDRTVYRYLHTLEMAGLLESRKINRGPNYADRGRRDSYQFRWIGWPEPFIR